jgi:hypothetical protein
MTDEENRLRARIENLERELDETRELAAVTDSYLKPFEEENEKLTNVCQGLSFVAKADSARIKELEAALEQIEIYEYDHTVDGCENCVRLQDIATRALGHER